MKDVSDLNSIDTTIQKIQNEVESTIRQDPNSDLELLKIITKYIITSSPDANAMSQVTTRIMNLAEKRARS